MTKKQLKLNAKERGAKEKGKTLIKEKMIPGVVYGSGSENISFKVARSEFEKIYDEAGGSSLVDLMIEGKDPIKILVQDVQVDPIRDWVIHIDCYKVDMNKKVTADVELRFIGESKAVRELGGVLSENMDEVEISCLPGDLIDFIEVDLAKLETFDDMIHVKDLAVPTGVEITNGLDEVIASITAQRAEEPEPEPAAEAPAAEGSAASGQSADTADKEAKKEEGEKK